MDQLVPEPADLRTAVDALLEETGVTWQRKLIARIIESGIALGLDGTSRLDLKISAAALEEMHSAFRLFAPYREAPKVTIFGSARTQAHDPLSRQAEAVSKQLAELGWLVVTGAGPGIMEAAATGAGPEHSLGVSIRLPFEELPEHRLAPDDRRVSMKYFFTRKLMLVKESHGFICLPGGFGTMDETFELLTLQQTGKMIPMPIVLLDRSGGSFWRGFERFVIEELEGTGMIAKGDLDRVLITDSAEEAVQEVIGFWRNYDSLRWIPDRSATVAERVSDPGSQGADSAIRGADRLVMRLRAEPTDAELAALNESFGSMLLTGSIERTGPFPQEVSDGDRLHLPRIVLTPRRRAIGELHHLIRALGKLASAPTDTPPPISD